MKMDTYEVRKLRAVFGAMWNSVANTKTTTVAGFSVEKGAYVATFVCHNGVLSADVSLSLEETTDKDVSVSLDAKILHKALGELTHEGSVEIKFTEKFVLFVGGGKSYEVPVAGELMWDCVFSENLQSTVESTFGNLGWLLKQVSPMLESSGSSKECYLSVKGRELSAFTHDFHGAIEASLELRTEPLNCVLKYMSVNAVRLLNAVIASEGVNRDADCTLEICEYVLVVKGDGLCVSCPLEDSRIGGFDSWSPEDKDSELSTIEVSTPELLEAVEMFVSNKTTVMKLESTEDALIVTGCGMGGSVSLLKKGAFVGRALVSVAHANMVLTLVKNQGTVKVSFLKDCIVFQANGVVMKSMCMSA